MIWIAAVLLYVAMVAYGLCLMKANGGGTPWR